LLFNSFPFIFIFLPITLVFFFFIAKKSHNLAIWWLALASFFFYGWWNPDYLFLLLTSITFNFIIGKRISISKQFSHRKAKYYLIFGITTNIVLLLYYKYLGFLIGNLNGLLEHKIAIPNITLPLGISFFTFTQLAFLVDTYQGLAKESKTSHYALFVTYFPHLIAGPVLHHKEMMPQFSASNNYQLNWKNMALGFSIFFTGLFKKLILADDIANYARPVFDAAAAGQSLSLLDSWGGALAYSFQLYFDFSAYSDMAIGLSLLFGIQLPLNFNSPYKATSIIEFWRRWHMTLSRFLRDYIYIPLGGNRKGNIRRYLNLIITMLLGGAWHGANWTFIVWGGLHGFYLLINHQWQASRLRLFITNKIPAIIIDKIALLITFIAIVVGWVIFRAENLMAAQLILEGMCGQHGLQIPLKWFNRFGDLKQWLIIHGVEFGNSQTFNASKLPLRLLICFLIIWCMPNTQEIFSRFKPALSMTDLSEMQKKWWQWQPTRIWLSIVTIIAVSGILSLGELSEFIYFQF